MADHHGKPSFSLSLSEQISLIASGRVQSPAVPVPPPYTYYNEPVTGAPMPEADSPLSGIGAPETGNGDRAMSAADFARMQFKTIGYRGQFHNVIADPADNFKMMVYGMPFQGKTSFVLKLCKDLALLNRGKLAYVSLEEGFSLSMQKKIAQQGLANVPGIEFLDKLPQDYGKYKFVVIDSVSDRGMKREDLRKIFEENTKTAFICIFHATKEGDARGGMDFKHDMDIILKVQAHVPQVEKNRFR